MLQTVDITDSKNKTNVTFTLPKGNRGLVINHLLTALSYVLPKHISITFMTHGS